MGKRKNSWQDTDSVLKLFGKSQYAARKKYRGFVEKGIGRRRNPEIGKYLGLSKSAVSRAANRGQKMIVDQFLSLKDYKYVISTPSLSRI